MPYRSAGIDVHKKMLAVVVPTSRSRRLSCGPQPATLPNLVLRSLCFADSRRGNHVATMATVSAVAIAAALMSRLGPVDQRF